MLQDPDEVSDRKPLRGLLVGFHTHHGVALRMTV
jgi:hypothetical protein